MYSILIIGLTLFAFIITQLETKPSEEKKSDNELKKTIMNLEDYINIDRIKRDNKINDDYDEFCENHCKDIEVLINEINLRSDYK